MTLPIIIGGSGMKCFKKALAMIAVLALFLSLFQGLFVNECVQAAAKPGKPAITVKVGDDGKSAVITIGKTKDAQGYKIMVKKPGAKKFTKLTTVKKDGTAERSYTAKKLAEGEYQFKVRAYTKSGDKTVWGKYSKVATVTLGEKKNSDDLADFSNLADAKTGDIITFGVYEQDNKTKNGKEPIQWIVLSNDGKEIFAVSKYVLDCQPYNTEDKGVTWETCTLRKWLNNDFYDAAFSSAEKNSIKTSTLKNNNNDLYDTPGGKDTKDKVFLLSLDEVVNSDYGFEDVKYNKARICAATEYAKAQGCSSVEKMLSEEAWKKDCATADGEPSCIWWLRSPGGEDRCASFGDLSGQINKAYDGVVFAKRIGVRPAIRISLKGQ